MKEVVVNDVFSSNTKFITSFTSPIFTIINYGDSNNTRLGEIHECINCMFGHMKADIHEENPP